MIRIDQTFPRCARCGRMIHLRAPRIEIRHDGGKPIVICSELCRDEYVVLHALSDGGEWRAPRMAGRP